MLSLLYVLRFGNYPSRQMKLQQIRGARIRKLKRVVKDFIVMSTRKNRVHEGVFITHTILFAYYFQARTSQLWLQFVAEENTTFYSYRRWFSKDKSTFVRDFWWDKKKTKLLRCEKLISLMLLITWAASVFYYLGLTGLRGRLGQPKYSIGNQTKSCGCPRGNWT